MRIKAALLYEQPGKWQVDEVELDEPRKGEVLVRMAYAGLCHSDDHCATGDVPVPLPFNGGHEGSGIVEAVGPGVTSLEVGDHIVASFVPSCGMCRWCAVGMQNLCDRGADILLGTMGDGTFRMSVGGKGVAQAGGLGTFAEYSVFMEESCIKVARDIPLDVASLVSCGVPTGWGSAVNAAQVQPGDVVIVMGIGGIGVNAVQGARHAGASRVIAVDLMEGKRAAAEMVGATDFTTDIDEATQLARSLTNGQGADSAIVTVSVVAGEPIAKAFAAIRKAGTVVVTSQGPLEAHGIPVNLFELSMYQKRIQGALYGMGSPRREVPRLLQMYQDGQLKLKELITKRYTLGEVNQGYEDMLAGRNIRGVIDFT
jgi:S-(hydroxymethyl)glutathione dehydrogenase/alcohol dehydrogenase